MSQIEEGNVCHKTQYCVSCLCYNNYRTLHCYKLHCERLMEIFKKDFLWVCFLCKRIIENAEWFIQSVLNNQILLKDIQSISDKTLKNQLHPICNLNVVPFDPIELSGNETDNPERPSIYKYGIYRDCNIKVEYKQEDDILDEDRGNKFTGDLEFNVVTVKEEQFISSDKSDKFELSGNETDNPECPSIYKYGIYRDCTIKVECKHEDDIVNEESGNEFTGDLDFNAVDVKEEQFVSSGAVKTEPGIGFNSDLLEVEIKEFGSESGQRPAKKAKSRDTPSSHQTQQSSQGSQNIIIETGHNQDQLNTRHTNYVIVYKKERRKRYREQNRDKLHQREAELNNEGIMNAQSSSGPERIQPSSIQRNDRGNKLIALQKKRNRQQRYRERNRDKLKQREAERRRRQQN